MEELLKGLMGSLGNEGGEKEPEEEASSDGVGLDPRMLMGMLELLGAVSAEEDSDRLIAALKPFISQERAESIDETLRVMKLVRAAKTAMKLWGGKGKRKREGDDNAGTGATESGGLAAFGPPVSFADEQKEG